jgi:hypothetical protein
LVFIAATNIVKPQLHSCPFLWLTFHVPDKIKVKASLLIKFNFFNSTIPIYSRFFCHVAMHMT